MNSIFPRFLLLGAITVLLAACDKATPPMQQHAKRPPPEVKVVVAHASTVPFVRELVGRLASTRVAQVRARVAGIILQRAYTEGTFVKKGQVLFQIDPAPLEANLHASEAALAKAEADAYNARLIAKRNRALAAKGLVSSQDLDNALANERTTAAIVKQAQANVEKAQLDLGYATVSAPISGYAGRALVTEGALVGQGEATQLTTVEQIDPIYVNFSQSVNNLQQMQQMNARDAATGQDKSTAKVEVIFQDGTVYPQTGTLDFSDMAVDPQTGSVSLRAIVPNAGRQLLPGMFVKLRVTMGQIDNAFVLPQATVLRDNVGAYVYVLDASGKVELRRVETHGMRGNDWIVTGKLADGDKVISEGLQKVRPGAIAKVAVAGSKMKQKPAAKH